MKILLCIMILIIPISALDAIASDDWDTLDKTLMGTLIISHTIDCLQIQYIFDNPEWHELNPVIRDGVDRYGKRFIPAYFIATTLVTALIADWVPSDYRKAWLGIWVGSSITTIHRNYLVGVGFKF